MSDAARFSPAQRTWWDRMAGRHSLDHSPGYLMMESIGRMFSPYELNPLDLTRCATCWWSRSISSG